jgi:ABC-2 type transport system ATP-binding protein
VKIIELKGVSKEFGKHLVLDKLDFVVTEGDICGIIGGSGSGKSTLLSLIVGFLAPEEGAVYYHSPATGKKYHLHSNISNLREKIGFTPQHTSFYPKLTVKENILHFGRMYKIKEKVLHENAKNLLEFTNLYKYRNVLAESLSGGMQKRLDISCSLVHKPKVLVLDEPTVDLDPLLRQDIMELIRAVNRQGVTIIVASHDLDNMELLCHKIAILHKKRIFAYGSVAEIKRRYGHKFGVLKLHTGEHHEKMLGHANKLHANSVIDKEDHLIFETNNLPQLLDGMVRLVAKERLPFTHIEMSTPKLRGVFERIGKQG